ncbi:MAG TPA: cytochrome c [Nitrospira sp.]|jgi:mono/diheme cytochrome c family protein|nr:cytochrome c [Nitrospira sp.]
MLFEKIMISAMTLSVLLGGLPSFTQAGDMAAGKQIYNEVCKACHGIDGRGPGAMKFSPPAADLTSREVQTKLDSGLYKSIHDGRANTAMGAWKYALSDEEIRNVISYVRTLGGDPSTP